MGHPVRLLRSPNCRRRATLRKEGWYGVGILRSLTLLVLDEGTCGRRRPGPTFSRRRALGQIMPFLYVLHVSIRKENVQERLLEMSGLIRAFHLDLAVHKLESLIMAQNERWRHA